MTNTNLAEDQNNTPAQDQEATTPSNVIRLDTRRAINDVINMRQKRLTNITLDSAVAEDKVRAGYWRETAGEPDSVKSVIEDAMKVEKGRVEQGLPDATQSVIEKKRQEAETARVQALGGAEGSEETKASMADIMKVEEERTGNKITPPTIEGVIEEESAKISKAA